MHKTLIAQLHKTNVVIPLSVFLLIFILYSMWSWSQWVTNHNPTWDQAIFTQLIKSYAAFQEPIVPVKGNNYNLLGDHFHPLLILLAPFYFLFPSTVTLLITQGALFAVSGGIFSYTMYKILSSKNFLSDKNKISSFFTRHKKLTQYALPFLCGLGFGASYGLQAAFMVQFHEIALSIPLLALSFHYFIFQKYNAAVLWAMPLVFIKEDFGLTLFLYGLVIFCKNIYRLNDYAGLRSLPHLASKKLSTPKNIFKYLFFPKYGVFLSLWGIIWVFLALKVLIPLLNRHHRYDYTGKTDISELFMNPLGILGGILLNPSKMSTIVALVLISAGAIILSPSFGVLTLPTLAWRFLSHFPPYWDFMALHYNAILMPMALYALSNLLYPSSLEPNKKMVYRSKPLIRNKNFQLFIYHAAQKIHYYGRNYALIIAAFFMIINFGSLVFQAVNPNNYVVNEETKTACKIADLIPEGSIVETDQGVMNYLVDKQAPLRSNHQPINTLYYVAGAQKNPHPDYIVLDVDGWSSNRVFGHGADNFGERVHQGSKYKIILNENGYQVAQKTN